MINILLIMITASNNVKIDVLEQSVGRIYPKGTLFSTPDEGYKSECPLGKSAVCEPLKYKIVRARAKLNNLARIIE